MHQQTAQTAQEIPRTSGLTYNIAAKAQKKALQAPSIDLASRVALNNQRLSMAFKMKMRVPLVCVAWQSGDVYCWDATGPGMNAFLSGRSI